MRPDLITEIMNEAPVKRYMIQTNGLLLNRLSPDILNRFETDSNLNRRGSKYHGYWTRERYIPTGS